MDFLIPKQMRNKNLNHIILFIEAEFILKSKLSINNILTISREMEVIKEAVLQDKYIEIRKLKIKEENNILNINRNKNILIK
jgi:hypothetical protein